MLPSAPVPRLPPRRHLGAAAAVALIAAIAPGCLVHRLPIIAAPVGASVSVNGTRVGVAPMDAPVPLVGPTILLLELSGYRPVPVRLGFFRPHGVEVLLVPEHGGAGTWDPSRAE